MARIHVHATQSAPEQSRDELKALEAKFGKVINIHGEMAHSPVVLLRRDDRRPTGRCRLRCKVDALLALARQYTTNIGSVEDAAWQAALDAGWSDEELTELSAHVTLNLLTNYFNHFVKTDLDLPAAPAL